MIGKIKVIGANNQTHLEWINKEFEGCKLFFNGSYHVLERPDTTVMFYEIYKTLILEDKFVFEGHASINGSLGRLALEFTPIALSMSPSP